MLEGEKVEHLLQNTTVLYEQKCFYDTIDD